MNVFVDVEDLFEHARNNRRPSGIQRVAFEIAHALSEMDGVAQTVRFLRHCEGGSAFRAVDWDTVAELFASLAGGTRPAQVEVPEVEEHPQPVEPLSLARRIIRATIAFAPLELREPLVEAISHQKEALGSAGKLGVNALSLLLRRAAGRNAVPPKETVEPEPAEPEPAFACDADFGDVLLVLGAPWFHPKFAHLLSRAKRERGIRIALLVYDLIPVRRPEWCVPELPAIFRRFIDGMLPLADTLLTISQATADDLVRYMAELGTIPSDMNLEVYPSPAQQHPLASKSSAKQPVVVPLGTGFSTPATGNDAQSSPRDLPKPRSYVLCVGTIEPRKNHALLLRLWRRLLDTRGPTSIPTLVLAGSPGWSSADLLQQLRNGAMSGAHVLFFENPTDAELRLLYAGCLFTVYPSFYEGWGLPVSESLAFGRACIVSSATALPEAGGTLARYFDPENGEQAYRLVSEALDNTEAVAAWEMRIAREFRPTSWRASAASILAALGGCNEIRSPAQPRPAECNVR